MSRSDLSLLISGRLISTDQIGPEVTPLISHVKHVYCFIPPPGSAAAVLIFVCV